MYFNILLDEIEKQIFELNDKRNRDQLDETLLFAFTARRDKMLKHYRKMNWIYCTSHVDPRHKTETFNNTVWDEK